MEYIDVWAFENVLSKNRTKIYNRLAPHFIEVLDDLRPSIDESTLQSLRERTDVIAAVLDLIALSNDKQVWFEFLKALDKRVRELRGLFLSDEVWHKGKSTSCFLNSTNNDRCRLSLTKTTTLQKHS